MEFIIFAYVYTQGAHIRNGPERMQMTSTMTHANSIEMEHTQKNKGISDMIQRFFEYIAHKHQYRLIVGITPESAAAFKNRVMNILRAIGYYIGPPSEKSDIYFGEHQSTYTGNGIPEIGTEAEYMLTPTIK